MCMYRYDYDTRHFVIIIRVTLEVFISTCNLHSGGNIAPWSMIYDGFFQKVKSNNT